MPSQRIKAGIARVIISPPKGIFLIGYGDRTFGNKGVHDDLTATALVLDNGINKLAIVAIDMLCMNEFIVDRVREKTPGIEPILCCSHTHSGPIGYAGEKSGKREREYMNRLVSNLAEAIQRAAASVHKAVLTWGSSSADIAVNRREKLPSGEVIIGEDPEGVVDRSVGVLSVSVEGNRLATLVNFACHGTVWGPDNLLVSADWIAAMRTKVEKELGGLCMFLQGAAGNLNPKMGWGREDCWQMAVSQGERVAKAVVTAASGKQDSIKGDNLDLMRQEVWLPFEARAETPDPPVDYRKRILKMANFPEWMAFATDYLLNIRYPWKPRIEAREGFWGTLLRVNTARIGSLALVTLGAEVFTEIGMKIKQNSPASQTIFASVSDGCISYLPTDAAHFDGGYEVELATYAYKYPGPLASGAEGRVYHAAEDSYNAIWK
jgi:Neutral/alkaline non-lysosomal ceramidase, N-terminal